MTPPDPGQKPPGTRRAQSSPEIKGISVDKTVGVAAMGQRRQESPRHLTNPALLATKLPASPDVPLEHQRTLPAPSTGTLPPASQDPRDAQLAAQQRELERLRALQSLPPDRGAWAKLGYRVAAAITAAVILVIAALGARLANQVGKVEDKNVALVKTAKKSKELVGEREKLWNEWGDRFREVLECRHRRQVELNKRQFPEAQRGEPGPWPVFKNDCGELPERPRELPAPPEPTP